MVPKKPPMKRRWWTSSVVGGVAVGLGATTISLFMNHVVTASPIDSGLGCPKRTAELAATIHYSMNGAYPSSLSQLSDDGFNPPNLSSDGLVAHTNEWTLRMVAAVPPIFSCD